MKLGILINLLICCIAISCSYDDRNNESMMEKYKNEILDTERAFAKLAKDKGLKIAFLTYASEEAVLNPNNVLIKGKEAIENYFDKQKLQNVNLEWEPEFIDVTSSGDLGYTYGP